MSRPYRIQNSAGRVVIVDATGHLAPAEHQPPREYGPGMAREWAIERLAALNREPAALPDLLPARGAGESRR